MCNRTEIHIIKKSDDLFKIIDDLCWRSKNLYNYANYMVRQEFINTSKEKRTRIAKTCCMDKISTIMQRL